MAGLSRGAAPFLASSQKKSASSSLFVFTSKVAALCCSALSGAKAGKPAVALVYLDFDSRMQGLQIAGQARSCTASCTAIAGTDWTGRWLRLAGWCCMGRLSVCCVTVLLCHHCWDAAAVGLAFALRLISRLGKPSLQKTEIGRDLQGGSTVSQASDRPCLLEHPAIELTLIVCRMPALSLGSGNALGMPPVMFFCSRMHRLPHTAAVA